MFDDARSLLAERRVFEELRQREERREGNRKGREEERKRRQQNAK